jgi:hypothetical protein
MGTNLLPPFKKNLSQVFFFYFVECHFFAGCFSKTLGEELLCRVPNERRLTNS